MEFIRSLSNAGIVQVHRPDVASDALEPDEPLEAAIREADMARRLESPGQSPELSIAAAAWALKTLHLACKLLVFRDLQVDALQAEIRAGASLARTASTCYSVDLFFSALPDLANLAAGVAADDPLSVALKTLAADWPLSAVGMTGVETGDIAVLMDNASLAQVYVDRIIQRRDLKRLNDPRVRAIARNAIGDYAELAPLVAAELKKEFHAVT